MRVLARAACAMNSRLFARSSPREARARTFDIRGALKRVPLDGWVRQILTKDNRMKDHEIREFVTELTKIAKDYADTQQLRGQISECVLNVLRARDGVNLGGSALTDGLDAVREQIKAQGIHGTWNYCPYMHGLYNGLECALATLEKRAPKFKSPPDEWICDESLIAKEKVGQMITTECKK